MKSYDAAKAAYDAYLKQLGIVSLVSGKPPDFFSHLSESMREAWWAAAEAVIPYAEKNTSESE